MKDDAIRAASRRSLRIALAIGVLYAATGTAWILWSDLLLQSLAADLPELTAGQHVKGILYVGVTAVCLVALVHWANRRVVETAWRSRQALQRQEDRFRQLHESLGDVVWLADARSGEIVYVSPSFEDVYGRAATDFASDPQLWLHAVVDADRAHAAALDADLRRLGGSSREYRIRRPDGTVRWISDRRRVIRDEDGEVRIVGTVAEDITASKALEGLREPGREALGPLLAERTSELRQLDAELDGQLALSSAQTRPLEPEPVDLAALAEEALEVLHERAPRRRVTLEPTAPAWAHGDRGLLRLLVRTLLGAAWQATASRPDARIRFAAGIDGARLRLTLQDDGPGPDAGGVQGAGAAANGERAGGVSTTRELGRAICRQIVERHGGEITWEPTPEGGTAVHLVVPAAAPHAS